ncbi:MAG: hypothetical protein HY078_15965 [Elusimicrobia bacterium]|nr:hypothetical protein [Elusimicrobiota bacterium]
MTASRVKDAVIAVLATLCVVLAALLYRATSAAPPGLAIQPPVGIVPPPPGVSVSPPQSAPPGFPAPNQRACTMEAKLCPDGSAVGRSGPNCEFPKCPGE